ncbi:type II toxin-antitoxin system VapC family toxin [soil metagenome]
MPFVLDSSVTLTWCFEDEATEYADRVLDLFNRDSALAPAIWPLEIANALRTAERRGRLHQADSTRFAVLLDALPISVESVPLNRALGVVLDIARTYEMTSYDASYLEIAMRMGLPLATQDRRLIDAAERAGVQLAK